MTVGGVESLEGRADGRPRRDAVGRSSGGSALVQPAVDSSSSSPTFGGYWRDFEAFLDLHDDVDDDADEAESEEAEEDADGENEVALNAAVLLGLRAGRRRYGGLRG